MTLCMKMPSGAAITDMMTPPWGLFYGGPPTDTDGGNGLALLLSQKLGSYNVRALPISRARPSLLRNSPARFGLTKTSRALWSSPEVLLKFRLPVRGIGSQLQSLEWEPLRWVASFRAGFCFVSPVIHQLPLLAATLPPNSVPALLAQCLLSFSCY